MVFTKVSVVLAVMVFFASAGVAKESGFTGCEIKRSCKVDEHYCLPIDQYGEETDERRVLNDYLRYSDQLRRRTMDITSGANRVNFRDTPSSRQFASQRQKRAIRQRRALKLKMTKLFDNNQALFAALNEQCVTLLADVDEK